MSDSNTGFNAATTKSPRRANKPNEYSKLGKYLAHSLDKFSKGKKLGPFKLKMEGRGLTKKEICVRIIRKLEKSRTPDKLNEIRASRQKLFRFVDKLPPSFQDFYYCLLYHLLLKRLYSQIVSEILQKLGNEMHSFALIKRFKTKMENSYQRILVQLTGSVMENEFKDKVSYLLAQIDAGTQDNSKRATVTKDDLEARIVELHEECEFDGTKFERGILKIEEDVLEKGLPPKQPTLKRRDPILTPLSVCLVEYFTNLPDNFEQSKNKAYRLAAQTYNYCFSPKEEQTEEHIRLRYASHWGRKFSKKP